MPIIKLEALKEGMIVSGDVRNLDHMLLIPAGCPLSGRQISILSSWGITEIPVEAGPGAEDPADLLQRLAPEKLEEITGEMTALFWEAPDANPVQQEVFNLVLRHRAAQALP
jgi:hypothetical protein